MPPDRVPGHESCALVGDLHCRRVRSCFRGLPPVVFRYAAGGGRAEAIHFYQEGWA